MAALLFIPFFILFIIFDPLNLDEFCESHDLYFSIHSINLISALNRGFHFAIIHTEHFEPALKTFLWTSSLLGIVETIPPVHFHPTEDQTGPYTFLARVSGIQKGNRTRIQVPE
ncbi:hypothetical protein QBC36DRAFT_336924 [Triangularia setosa]|uniref:Uncharacterized protein n=1 Tax=Triangularia setosa TaxID=2587417 RepID=A0AAN6W0Z3_9PEZI|nr:hypothetical protein QBC36DRAFT_336924 [Podospora setosa]